MVLEGEMANSQRIAAAILGAVLGATTSAAAFPNLIVNPGFETGDFTGWTVGGTATNVGVATDGTLIPGTEPNYVPSFQNVRSGNYAAHAVTSLQFFGEPIERVLFSQTVAVQPDTQYFLGLWIGLDAPQGAGFQVGPDKSGIFVDGQRLPFTNGVPPAGIPPGSGPDDFLLLRTFFESGSRSSVDVTFALSAGGVSRAGMSYDDFFLVKTVPEPGTLSLLLLGLPGIVGFRRRLR
jgi:hypothetical protein